MSAFWDTEWIKKLYSMALVVQETAKNTKDELINKSLTAGKPTDQELLYNMRCQIELAEYMAGLVVETLEVQMKQAGSKIEEGG